VSSKLAIMGQAVLDEFGYSDWRVRTMTGGDFLGCVSFDRRFMLLNTKLYDQAPADSVIAICHELAHIRSGVSDHSDGFSIYFEDMLRVPQLTRVYHALDRHTIAIRSAALN